MLVELPDGLDEAEVESLADDLLRRLGERTPVLMHGEGNSCWPALRSAVRHGLSTRIGLEDVLELPDGTPASDNAALVRAARTILPGRPVGTAG